MSAQLDKLNEIREAMKERIRGAKRSLPKMGEWREQKPLAERSDPVEEAEEKSPGDEEPVVPAMTGSGAMPMRHRVLRIPVAEQQNVNNISRSRGSRRAVERTFVR